MKLPSTSTKKHLQPSQLHALQALQASDLQGLAQLATDGVLGVAGIAESLHGTVLKTVAAPLKALGPMGRWLGNAVHTGPGLRPGGITGQVYGGVRLVTRLAGGSVQTALNAGAAPLLAWRRRTTAHSPSPAREAFVSALNGVLGDHLAATLNPLAIDMAVRLGGMALPLGLDNLQNQQALARLLPSATGKVVLLVHGLCMNDLQWPDLYSKALAKQHGYTPVYLHYNTGLAIADNGRQLSALLEQLVRAWPQPVDSLAIVAHSMGGLVARSSCLAADSIQKQTPLQWRKLLQKIVFLGTPHQGAPLEQLGRWVDGTLGAFRFTRPFARIGKIRSRGIGDLQDGRITNDGQRKIALPAGVACFAIAGSLSCAANLNLDAANMLQKTHDQLLGDGLVPVASALGLETLHFALENTRLLADCGHMDLMEHPKVKKQLVQWL